MYAPQNLAIPRGYILSSGSLDSWLLSGLSGRLCLRLAHFFLRQLTHFLELGCADLVAPLEERGLIVSLRSNLQRQVDELVGHSPSSLHLASKAMLVIAAPIGIYYEYITKPVIAGGFGRGCKRGVTSYLRHEPAAHGLR